MKLNFQRDVIVLPASVLSHCAEADATAMRVLLWLASDLSLAQKPKQLAKLADCDTRTVKAMLNFWEFSDVLVKDEDEEEAVGAEEKPKKRTAAETPSEPAAEKKPLLQRANEMPTYTTDEIAKMLETRDTMRLLIDEAQREIGKMFNSNDINIIVGMRDYLGLGEEAILLILAHCKRIGKKTMRAAEQYAFSLVDRGITEAEQVNEAIRVSEALHTFEGEVRTLFGMKSRALTSRESKMLEKWISFGYGIDVVKLAYEMTVSATNEASVPYANAIIERWNAEGLQTLEQIEAAVAAQKEQKEKKDAAPKTGSFDTDDFFEAALKKSFSTRRED